MLVESREDERIFKVKRILEIVSQNKISVYRIAKSTNLNQSGLNRWINDKEELTGTLPNSSTINIVLTYLENEVLKKPPAETLDGIVEIKDPDVPYLPDRFKKPEWVIHNLETLIENPADCSESELLAIRNGVAEILNQRNEVIEKLSKIQSSVRNNELFSDSD